ncbi:hypothetical protein D9M68_733430 [compost metagenome]
MLGLDGADQRVLERRHLPGGETEALVEAHQQGILGVLHHGHDGLAASGLGVFALVIVRLRILEPATSQRIDVEARMRLFLAPPQAQVHT